MGRNHRFCGHGQSLVEFALIAGLLFVVIFGLIELGRAIFIWTAISNAAREGARYGLVHPLDTAGIDAAATHALGLVSADSVAITVTYDDGSQPITDTGALVQGSSRVKVGVSYRFSMITPLISALFPPTEIRFVSARTIAPVILVEP